MSEWVVLDITAFTKTTNKDKVLKILKAGGMTVCKVTDQYQNTARNKNAISVTVKRADYETKTPDYPGQNILKSSSSGSSCFRILDHRGGLHCHA